VRRVAVVALLAAVAVLLAATPTGSLSATQADRGVAGTVASDPEAYVGIEMEVERPEPTATDSTRSTTTTTADATQSATVETTTVERSDPILHVTIRNQLPSESGFTADVSVVYTLDGDTETVSDRVVVDDVGTAELSPVSCDDAVRIVVETDDVSVQMERPVPCEG
jgi:hypothetical protein